MIWTCLLIAVAMSLNLTAQAALAAPPGNEERAWKVYTNARFGFSVCYPETWRLGNPLPDGVGVHRASGRFHSLPSRWWSSQANTVSYQTRACCGLRIQWFSSGK